MSEEIYNRAMVREQAIWPSFLYNIPDANIEATKATIFGLYANVYLFGHNYLENIETEELQRLVDVYDSNMAELDMNEQSLVLKIASDRYLKAIEIQIKNEALTTKAQQLSADEQEYDAKLAALDVDREALETKRSQIELARDRAELKNNELVAQIQLEQLAQDYVAVEISQKELEVAQADLKVLLTALRGIEIQLDITNTSYRIVELESSKAGIEVDIAMAKVRTEENEFTRSSQSGSISERTLYNEEEDYDTMKYEIKDSSLENKKIDLIEEREDTIEKEKDHITNTLILKEYEIQLVKESNQTARHDLAMETFANREDASGGAVDRSGFDKTHKITDIALPQRTHRATIATKKDEIYPAQASAANTVSDAAIAAAVKMATANIVSTLTHEIGSA